MTDKNPYENDSTIDIPDFVEDTDTNSSDLDMSIFKMSDEELYDDVNKKKNTEEPSKSSKGSDKSSLIVCLIIIGLLLATSCASIFYALNQKKATEEWKDKYYTISTKLPEENKNNNTSANSGNNTGTNENTDANKPEESKGTVYVIKDGPISFRSSPERDTTPSNIITYDGKDSAKNGEEYTILETITNKDSDGDSYTWGKIADKVYLCIAHGSDYWAEKKN